MSKISLSEISVSSINSLQEKSMYKEEDAKREPPLEWWQRAHKTDFGMKTILLVDDDETFRKAQAKVLERAGFKVVLAENGLKALEAFQESHVDMVITDIIMPEIKGLETIQKLRQINRNVKIIAISGGGRNTPDDYLILARKLGAMRSLSKPYTATELLAAIDELM